MFHDHGLRRAVPLVLVAVLLLGAGAAVAQGVGSALGLTSTPASVPVERTVPAAARAGVPAPLISTIVVPDDPRLRLAASAVSDALVARGLPAPTLTATGTPSASTLPPASTRSPTVSAPAPRSRPASPVRDSASGSPTRDRWVASLTPAYR